MCIYSLSIIRCKDVAFRTDDGKAPTRFLERFEEDVAIFSVESHVLVTVSAVQHFVPQHRQIFVIALFCGSKDILVEQLGAVGVNEIVALSVQHDAVGVRVGLYL